VTTAHLRAMVERDVVEAIVQSTPAAQLVHNLHSIALGGVGRVADVQAACQDFIGQGDVGQLVWALEAAEASGREAASAEAAFALQVEEASAASREQAEHDEIVRKKARRREGLDLRNAMVKSRELQEQEDFNVALNLGRPEGPWLAEEHAKRTKCGLPGCVGAPQREHHGFCCLAHRQKAEDRGLLAPPSDEIERCFVGPGGDFSCLLLTNRSSKRAEIVEQFLGERGRCVVVSVGRNLPLQWTESHGKTDCFGCVRCVAKGLESACTG
jgi:hypothetical protein